MRPLASTRAPTKVLFPGHHLLGVSLVLMFGITIAKMSINQ